LQVDWLYFLSLAIVGDHGKSYKSNEEKNLKKIQKS